MKTVANKIASLVAARANCLSAGNTDWHARHGESLARIIQDCMPSGGGFDCGAKLDEADCRGGERLVFTTSFHHMDAHGGYDGWTSHKVTVRPSLVYALDIRVSGRDRNGIKEYIAEMFHAALSADWTE